MSPAVTGSGESVFVIDRSAEAATVVVSVSLSLPGLGSGVVDDAVAVFDSTVPAATDGATATTKVKSAGPGANDVFVHDTVPPAPSAGVVQLHPPGDDNDTKVVPAGNVSLKDAAAALLGPAFVTVIV